MLLTGSGSRPTEPDGETTVCFRDRAFAADVAMTMQDWITKLEGFLSLNDRVILQNVGTVSAELARAHADRFIVKGHLGPDEPGVPSNGHTTE